VILAATHAPGKLEQGMGTVHHSPGMFSPPIRLDKGLPACPTLSRFGQIIGEVGPGAQPYPPDGWGAKPDLGPGADAKRHLYDHADVVSGLRCWGRADASGTPDSTAAAAWCGERGAAWSGTGADP
jgi:hypothetical protein